MIWSDVFPVLGVLNRPLVANSRGVPRSLWRFGHLVDDGAVYGFLSRTVVADHVPADDGVVASGIKPISPRIGRRRSNLPGQCWWRGIRARCRTRRRIVPAGPSLGLAQARPPAFRVEFPGAGDMRTPGSRTRDPGMSRRASHCLCFSTPVISSCHEPSGSVTECLLMVNAVEPWSRSMGSRKQWSLMHLFHQSTAFWIPLRPLDFRIGQIEGSIQMAVSLRNLSPLR